MNTIFKALNDPTRRRILEILRNGDLSAGDISDHFDASKPTLSHHLDLLRQAGMVDSYRKGQFIMYTLNTSVLDETVGWLLGLNKS